MLDLSVLKNLWTEDGAREVFAQLVTHCVASNHPGARAIRPDPGDEGVDTFAGEFGTGVRVWQAKYFPDGIGESQQKQIRESWKAALKSSYRPRLLLWTLCVPCELSIQEQRWWEKWKGEQVKKTEVPIELWTKSMFTSFSVRKELAEIFACALKQVGNFATVEAVKAAMRKCVARPVHKLPETQSVALQRAVFVRKLEAAGITKHRAARVAFYNFELVRKVIEEGGTQDEMSALEDLQERTYAVWETLFNQHCPERLGRALYNSVEAELKAQDSDQLATPLNLHLIHKRGGLHHWADICEAGWTEDHATLIDTEEHEAQVDADAASESNEI